MTPSPPIVRPGQLSDLAGIVRCHIVAFPGQPMTEMGARWLAALYRCYLDHQQGAAVVAVNAAQDVVGFVVGGEPSIRSDFIRRARIKFAPLILWRVLTRPAIRRRLCNYLLSLLRRHKEPESQDFARREADRRGLRLGTLLSIAVLPEAQGSGVARELVAAFCDACRKLGFGYLELGVYTCNERAIAFYRKTGWQQIGRSADQTYFGLDLTGSLLDPSHR